MMNIYDYFFEQMEVMHLNVYRTKCVIESVTDVPLKSFEAAVQLGHLYFAVATYYKSYSNFRFVKTVRNKQKVIYKTHTRFVTSANESLLNFLFFHYPHRRWCPPVLEVSINSVEVILVIARSISIG